MSFLDPAFFLFLPVVLGTYHALRIWTNGRMALQFFLFLASCAFYSFLYPPHLALLVGSSFCAWSASHLLDRQRSETRRRIVYVVSFAGLLLPLFYYKYFNFGAGIIRDFGIRSETIAVVLPLGISFFTFQNISYLTDVHRRTFPPERNPLSYLVYLTFFPHLGAGPIVTAKELLPQLHARGTEPAFREGAFWLVSGFVKKAVFADRLARIVDPVYLHPDVVGSEAAWLAVLAYSLQIYFDFSGYSDMAIGMAHFFGYRLPENFRFPYSATSVRDFWRRWHITLSSWLRDHIYIPAGGSRHGVLRLSLALFLTMALGGLWHGAHWNFVLWGMGHGVLLAVERWIGWTQWTERTDRIGMGARAVGLMVTFSLVTLLWVFFRAGSFPDGFVRSGLVFHRLVSWSPGSFSESDLRFVVLSYIMLIASARWFKTLEAWARRADPLVLGGASALVGCVVLLAAPGSSGFIYFVF